MPRAYYSSVLNHPADRVWGLVRDFNNYPRYIEGVTESVIEDGERGDQVGAVRRFRYGGSWIRQRLTAHSDTERSFTYAGMEPFEFPARDRADVPTAIDYAGTLRLSPVIDGARTFIEWFVDFDCQPDETARWTDLLMELIPQWVASLRRAQNDLEHDRALQRTSRMNATAQLEKDASASGADRSALRSIRRFYDAEARYSRSHAPGDRAALLATLHPDIVLHQPSSLPYGGVWNGREAFGQWLDAFTEAWTDVTPTDPALHACGDDLLVISVTMYARARATENAIHMPICQVNGSREDYPSSGGILRGTPLSC